MTPEIDYKKQAAVQALELVRSGMVLGLGSGSTIAHFIDELGARLRSGQLQRVCGVPTSLETAQRATAAGIALTTLAAPAQLELAVDGADEIDAQCNLIKGLGRCMLREKVVVQHALQFVVVADDSKRVGRLGTRGPLPVEILPFEAGAHVRWLGTLGCRAELWLAADGTPLVTDNGNQLAKCWFTDGIGDPWALALQLQARAGIVEQGLFLGMATQVITVHAEACGNLSAVVQVVRQLGCRVGVAINPPTAVQVLEPVLQQLDLALIMSVTPGFGGQAYFPSSTAKVAELSTRLDALGATAELQVDGGIGADNAAAVAQAGATVLVAGSAVFGGTRDVAANLRALQLALA